VSSLIFSVYHNGMGLNAAMRVYFRVSSVQAHDNRSAGGLIGLHKPGKCSRHGL